MDFARGPSPTSTDDYILTAHQIFQGCGVENTSPLHVDDLIEKLAPYLKTKKTELSILKTLLDRDHCNPEVNVTKLANALHEYSESYKSKMDLDESFNLRNGQSSHDADSGISTDGPQLLEELQCELKEKEFLANKLRSQLDLTDRQHEEALAALTAERDSLKQHLNVLREENAALSHVRQEYDETCERLCSSGAELEKTSRELETLKRRARVTADQLATLEADKLTLQELLSKSKDECHRINDMYASRQAALRQENESLKSQHAELSCRFQSQEEFVQQIIKDKSILEMELKDVLNKSNQTHLRFDRSIDVSFTDDQMLTALDSLNADSRFSSGNRILDEESFLNALAEDQGRCTNLSLFDEIKMSFNISRLNLTELHDKTCCDKCHDKPLVAIGTQTESDPSTDNDKNKSIISSKTQFDVSESLEFSTETSSKDTQTEYSQSRFDTVETQTDEINIHKEIVNIATQTDLINDDLKRIDINDDSNDNDLYCGGDNAQNGKHNAVRKLNFETSFEDGLTVEYKSPIAKNKVKVNCETQTDAIHVELNTSGNSGQYVDAKDCTDAGCQTIGKFIRKPPPFVKKARKLMALQKIKQKNKDVGIQTDIQPNVNNNNVHCTKCLECDNTDELRRDVTYADTVLKEMADKIVQYEENLTYLRAMIDQGAEQNEYLQSKVDEYHSKMEVLENACETQRDVINKVVLTDTCCVQSQTVFDYASVSTQVELDCQTCERRKANAPSRVLRRFFWEPLKCLFQIFAVVCFIGAVSLLYGVTRRGAARCERDAAVTPWRWFHAQDIMDLLLRIEYTAEVPM